LAWCNNPPKTSFAVLQQLKLEDKSEATLKTAQLKELVALLKGLKLPIQKTRAQQYAEVTIGGVNSNEVAPKTLQSKKQKGLYFCGEVLDVVGDRGGYNFFFAWCSAFCVADAIAATP